MGGEGPLSSAAAGQLRAAVLINDEGEVEARVDAGARQKLFELPDPRRRLRLVRRFVRTQLETAEGERIYILHEVVDPCLEIGKLLHGNQEVDW